MKFRVLSFELEATRLEAASRRRAAVFNRCRASCGCAAPAQMSGRDALVARTADCTRNRCVGDEGVAATCAANARRTDP
jgi:hypothetical protein